jgi:putative ABC transport system ATP-binding protein
VIAVNDLDFQFPQSDFRLTVPSLNVSDGERVAIVGPSGSGKTTLLHLIAGILTPARGRIRVQDQTVSALGDARRRAFRVARVGLVFQSFELVSYLDVLENILLPYRLNAALPFTPDVPRRAAQLAAETGLAHRLRYFPHRLSHGEKQRVAICRALLPDPPLLLADEPTGNLDPKTADHVFGTLTELVKASRVAALVATHNLELAARMDRRVTLREGRVEEMA